MGWAEEWWRWWHNDNIRGIPYSITKLVHLRCPQTSHDNEATAADAVHVVLDLNCIVDDAEYWMLANTLHTRKFKQAGLKFDRKIDFNQFLVVQEHLITTYVSCSKILSWIPANLAHVQTSFQTMTVLAQCLDSHLSTWCSVSMTTRVWSHSKSSHFSASQFYFGWWLFKNDSGL